MRGAEERREAARLREQGERMLAQAERLEEAARRLAHGGEDCDYCEGSGKLTDGWCQTCDGCGVLYTPRIEDSSADESAHYRAAESAYGGE